MGRKAMTKQARVISLLADKKELELLEEACIYGADANDNIEKAVKEGGNYRIKFSYEELDDLGDFVAERSNNAESSPARKRWDALYAKIDGLLKYNEPTSSSSSPHSHPTQPCALRHYIFVVRLESGRGVHATAKVIRRIQIADQKSLYNFAKVITQSFGFYFDHCFGFYDDFRHYHDSKKAYELFVDIGEEPLRPHFKGVKKSKISQAFTRPGDKMLFFFDYGDGWRFAVKLEEIRAAHKWDLKPVILESVGDAPMQYPPLEEERPGEW